MDKINLNLYGLNYQSQVQKKDDKKAEEEKQPAVETKGKDVETGALLDAMALSGVQNLTFAGLNQINPKDYLDDESIARIQAAMPMFTGAVERFTKVIEEEFPGLNEAQVQELALQAAVKTV